MLPNHAKSVANEILSEQVAGPSEPCTQGGFDADGRTTPAATRLEGLIALQAVMPQGSDRSRIEKSVEAGIRFLQMAQLTVGPAVGGFSRVSAVCHAIDRRAREVRIDYVQHALAALLGYRARLAAR